MAIHSNLLESGMNINDSNYLASVIEEDRTMSIFFHFHMKEYAWQQKKPASRTQPPQTLSTNATRHPDWAMA